LGVGRHGALLFTFGFSALVHEFIIAWGLGFFYPVLLVMFLGFGVTFIYVTRIFRGHVLWNIFFWLTLTVGNGVLMVLYSREYYSHNPPADGLPVVYPLLNAPSWMPYSWQPFFAPFPAPT
jgi:hypothetical protein